MKDRGFKECSIQIKQEFVSARFLYFEGTICSQPSFSDRGALLYNTLDYPCYGLSIEKVKLAFRATYSLLDKIAFLLNAYLKLGVSERATNFRTLWYRNQDRKQGIRKEF